MHVQPSHSRGQLLVRQDTHSTKPFLHKHLPKYSCSIHAGSLSLHNMHVRRGSAEAVSRRSVLQRMFSVASYCISPASLSGNEKHIFAMSPAINCTHMHETPKGGGAAKLSQSIGGGIALIGSHAHMLRFSEVGGLRQMFSVCPIIKWVCISDLAFIFLWMGARDIQSLWDTESPAALTNWKSQCQFVLYDSLRILTGECRDKRIPFERRWQVAAVVLYVVDKLQRNWMEPDYC